MKGYLPRTLVRDLRNFGVRLASIVVVIDEPKIALDLAFVLDATRLHYSTPAKQWTHATTCLATVLATLAASSIKMLEETNEDFSIARNHGGIVADHGIALRDGARLLRRIGKWAEKHQTPPPQRVIP